MIRTLVPVVLAMAQLLAPQAHTASTAKVEPVKSVGIYVLPYYRSADTPGGAPMVHVGKRFDALLSSNRKQDILAVRDMLREHPGMITPMTMMVLAIRLYDVGLRDQSVFWFYAAKDRYFTLAGVLDMHSPGLSEVPDIVGNFATLAGPVINSYAFCDLKKQEATEQAALDWVKEHPYQVMFMNRLPAQPGNREANLEATLKKIRARIDKERDYMNQPATIARLESVRKTRHVDEMFCWK